MSRLFIAISVLLFSFLAGCRSVQPTTHLDRLTKLNDSQRVYVEWTTQTFGSLEESQYASLSDRAKGEMEKIWLTRLKTYRGSGYYDAINGLGAIQSQKAFDPLAEIAFETRQKDNRDRWMAVRALGYIGDERAIPMMIHLVYHYNMNTRFWAQISLVKMTGQNFGTDWRAWGQWWDNQGKEPEFDSTYVRWTDNKEWGDPEKQKQADDKFIARHKGENNTFNSVGSANESASAGTSNGNSRMPAVDDGTPAGKKSLGGSGLQVMIDAAEAGSTVLIPDGVYTEPITINKPLVVKGEKCVFEVTADRPAILIDTAGKEASLEGITIKWQLATSDQHESPFAVAVKDTNATIKNCVFRSLGDPQRSPVGVRAMGFSTMTLTDCDFTGFDYVVCYGEGTKGKMEGCFIRNCGHQGVILYSGANAEVNGTIITGSRYHAVRSTGGTLRMKDNLIINNKNRGVYLGNKSSQGVITNNLLIGNATGIDGISASRYQVANNVILNSEYAAISAVPQAQLDIQGNVLMNNTRGIIVQQKEGQVDPVRSKWANNVYWNNKADTENCDKGAGAVEAQPDFIDAAGGNYKMTDAAFKGMGLSDPEKLYFLWKKYKEKM